jgi:hypothetical protein
LYVPYEQAPVRQMTVVARTSASPDVVFAAARASVRELDPDLPLFELSTLQRRFQESAARPRLYMSLLAAFASVAVLLAAISSGWCRMRFDSRRRDRHPPALGATSQRRPRGRRHLVEGNAVRRVGLAGALGVSRPLGALLFGVSPTDPQTYGAVVVVILLVGVLASWTPARRATSIDPASALRSE